MAKIPQISEAEWEVMKTLWEQGPQGGLASGEVVQRIVEAGHDWAPRTIKTLLARLVKKGAAGVQRDEKRVLYVAKVNREAVIRRESRSFIARVFDGAVTPALVHLIEEGRLTSKEIDELKRVLDRERP
jgi:BlaI family penicillinase repressor